MKLRGKAAIVTGGAGGIGAAIARRFVEEGAAVVVLDCIAPASGKEAGGDCHGNAPLWIEADVADTENHGRILAETVERLEGLDILVNNAGVQIREPFLEARCESWDRIFAVNLKGPYFLSQRAALQMRPGGRIINIASVHDQIPHRNNSIYCLTKAAMKMLTKCLALELAERGIRVNAISPGAIETGINRDVLSDDSFRQTLVERIPVGRVGSPADIAGLAVYLASQESDYITGSTYYVDGGLLLR
jgi:glucose 1-dehydrogenase